MSNPVYSQPFVQYTPDTPNLQYLVPAGYTAVVRQLTIVNTVSAYEYAWYIADSEAAPQLTIAFNASVTIQTDQSQEGRWVVGEGGLIGLYVSVIGDNMNAYAGGYLLRNSGT